MQLAPYCRQDRQGPRQMWEHGAWKHQSRGHPLINSVRGPQTPDGCEQTSWHLVHRAVYCFATGWSRCNGSRGEPLPLLGGTGTGLTERHANAHSHFPGAWGSVQHLAAGQSPRLPLPWKTKRPGLVRGRPPCLRPNGIIARLPEFSGVEPSQPPAATQNRDIRPWL